METHLCQACIHASGEHLDLLGELRQRGAIAFSQLPDAAGERAGARCFDQEEDPVELGGRWGFRGRPVVPGTP